MRYSLDTDFHKLTQIRETINNEKDAVHIIDFLLDNYI